MKKIIIVSQNFNSFCPVNIAIKQSDKIIRFADYLKSKYPNFAEVAIICIQEFLGGKNGKYIEELEGAFNHSFEVLTPWGFNNIEHPRSVLTVTLIRKELPYNTVRLESCLPNRICYSRVWFPETGKFLRILNIYAVQTSVFSPDAAGWYIAKRREQQEDLWSVILKEAAERCSDSLLIVGDMQESSKTGKHIKKLLDMGFKEKATGEFFPTVREGIFFEQNIDHYLYNEKAWNDFYPVSMEYDGNLLDELSDHILLAAVSA